MCVCVQSQVQVCVHVYVCGGRKMTSDVISLVPSLSSENESIIGLELAEQAWLWSLSVSASPVLRLNKYHHGGLLPLIVFMCSVD